MTPGPLFCALACLAVGFGVPSASAATAAAPPNIALDNGQVRLEVTPAFGGRVLAWHLAGEPNVLKVGADAIRQQPSPAVTAAAGDIPYLGHDVWVGPQSQWWLHQDVNAPRRQAAANWPPDPYLSLASTRVVAHDARQIRLEGVDSPVTGVRLTKQFRLADDQADTVLIEAQARNIRDEPISWDLWFNTRVRASTRVFVPLASVDADMDLVPATDAGMVSPRHHWEAGLFALTAEKSGASDRQRGKYRLQPSAGWMAGFAGHQVLLIRFEHQPRASIHPEQGQIELYMDAPSRAPEEGLIEMEVHAPYRQLAPGASMQAAERWTLLRYDGPDDAQAQRAFLCHQAARLALDHACPD